MRRVLILGAAGRDFHNFNVVFRDDRSVDVVAFTATQIPGIDRRRYPADLAGVGYPDGIPIVPESELESVCRQHAVEEVVFAYSDVPHAHVMHLASRALAGGADFVLLGPERTMVRARVPVIAVSAVRTGCGKSQTARWLSGRLRAGGTRVSVVRHPMPYGNLSRQAVQRFATAEDLGRADCTIEEREEYEPHIASGNVVFAGVDYARIIAAAEREADVVVWDGGNNDFPFVRPDLHFVLVDPLRPGHETSHHPGEAVLRMADVVLIAKSDTASPEQIESTRVRVRAIHPAAPIVCVESPITLDDPSAVAGRRVLVVEDGPTTTHGGMPWGAGYLAAMRAGAAAIVDPRPWCTPEFRAMFAAFPHIGSVLPAMGYAPEQLAELETVLRAADADVIVAGTPINLAALVHPGKPIVRARYEFADVESRGVGAIVDAFVTSRADRA